MKKILQKILEQIKPLQGTGCCCNQCVKAREFIPQIETELAKIGPDEIVDLELLILSMTPPPGEHYDAQDERALKTLKKILTSIQ